MNGSPVPKNVQQWMLIERTFRITAGLHDQGRLSDADQLYQVILALKPDHFGSLFRLATMRARAGQLEVAMALFRRAAAVDPSSADVPAALGSVLAVAGRRDEAIACYQKAVSLDAGHAEAQHAFAATLYALGRTEEAIARFQRAVAIKPGYAEAHFALANVLQGVNRTSEAITHYEKVIALQPGHVEAHNNLANVLQRLGRFEEAIACYERALAIDPEYVDAHFNLGNVLLALNRNEEAIGRNEMALRLNPSKVEALNNIGVALMALGRLEEAGVAYERVFQIAPRLMAAHLNVAYLRNFKAGDPRLDALEKFAEEMPTLDADDKISLHFALGKAYGDLQQYERSFDHLREGNALKRRQLAYDEKEVLDLFERIRTIFTRNLVKQKSGGGDGSRAPVFVVGMPRSGTTLVEKILASHSRIYGAGQIEAFSRTVAGFKNRESSDEFPELISTMSPEDLRDLGSSYVRLVGSLAPTMERVVNKLPLNFIFIGLIHLALPNARIIHVRRDPLDTCFSLLFTGNQPFTYDLGELGRYYRGYAALMDHWHDVLPKGVMIDVQYEKLVDDIEGQARALIAHCGLEWEDACRAFYNTERSVQTASAVQVRAPVYRSSIGRWRRYERFLQPLLEALN
jgi:tetratricopeptide (TPR) repeat protein